MRVTLKDKFTKKLKMQVFIEATNPHVGGESGQVT